MKYIKQSRETYWLVILSISLGYISTCLIPRNIRKVSERIKKIINNYFIVIAKDTSQLRESLNLIKRNVKKKNAFYELIVINTSCFFHTKERNDIGRVTPLPSIMRWYLQNMYQSYSWASALPRSRWIKAMFASPAPIASECKIVHK